MTQLIAFAALTATVLAGTGTGSPVVAASVQSVLQTFDQSPIPGYSFRDAYPYSDGPIPLSVEHAVLTVPNTQVRQAQITQHGSQIPTFSVDIRLYNDQGSMFYNVFWNRREPLPGHLALYDVNKHYVMDLLDTMSQSGGPVGAPGDWIEFPVGDYVGATVLVSLPYPTYRVITPGTYYLQVIYTKNAILQPGDIDKPTSPSDTDQETFRSNAVKITVVD